MPSESRGQVRASLTVLSPDLLGSEVVDLLVDTGASLTWVPREVAARLRITPMSSERFRTIHGGAIERPIAEVRVELEGERRFTLLVPAEPGDQSVRGCTPLEGLGLEVDPKSRALRMSDAQLATAV